MKSNRHCSKTVPRLLIFRLFPILIIITIMTYTALHPLESDTLEDWKAFSKSEKSSRLLEWTRCMAEESVSGRKCHLPRAVETPPFYGKTGLFITINYGKKVRGCCGSFTHSHTNFATQLKEYITCATGEDHRYAPLESSELKRSTIYLTVTSQPFLLKSIDSIDPRYYGIYMECDGHRAVFVPAELKNTASIAKLIRNKNCTLYAFRAVTLKSLPYEFREMLNRRH